MTQYIQDGGHYITSLRKVLPFGEYTRIVIPNRFGMTEPGFLKRSPQAKEDEEKQQQHNNKISSDMRSVHNAKMPAVKNDLTNLSLRYLISPSASIFTAASSTKTDVKKKLKIFRANFSSCKNAHRHLIGQSFK